MDLLFPHQHRDVSDAEIADLYHWPTPGQWLRANMVNTLDGMARGADGLSGSISSAADKRVFRQLRRSADAIVVGAGTARSENYGPANATISTQQQRLAAGQLPFPRLVLVTKIVSLRADARVFSPPADCGANPAANWRPLVALPESSLAKARENGLDTVAELVVVGETEVLADQLLHELASRGLRRLLTEGGPTLLAQLVAYLDDLCLTTSPLLAGAAGVKLLAPELLGGATLAHSFPFQLGHLLHEQGTLLARWVRATRE